MQSQVFQEHLHNQVVAASGMQFLSTKDNNLPSLLKSLKAINYCISVVLDNVQSKYLFMRKNTLTIDSQSVSFVFFGFYHESNLLFFGFYHESNLLLF